MKKHVQFILLALLLSACGGKTSTSDPQPNLPPLEAVLLYPEQNSLCITGVANSTTQSTITFKWNASANTNSYMVTIKNLLTGIETTQASSQPQLSVALTQGTPFSWYVTSMSDRLPATAKSATWKFYNSGQGVVSYAPFPADNLQPNDNQIVTPVSGQTGLGWHGSDTDNDIVDYDIYFGTTVTPSLYKAHHTAIALTNVDVRPASKYYWKVITRDSKGNTSESDVGEFKTSQ